MGVLVSPAARSTVPNRMLAVRNSMGTYRMKKYRWVSSRMEGSTCIHTGTMGLKPSVSAVKSTPTTQTIMAAWAEARCASSFWPAPQALAI